MTKLEKLIKELCPNGVEFVPLWSVTAWDKRFTGVDRIMQQRVISYKYYLSSEFDEIEREDGNIPYISTGVSSDKRFTTEELAGDHLFEGEIVCIPWGGTPNVKYYKGKFVTGDNRIATSLYVNILSNKFLYYWLQSTLKIWSKFYRGAGLQHPSMKLILKLKIPLPPLKVQCEVVRILDDYTERVKTLQCKLQEELDARRKQYEYYRNKLLSLDTLNAGCEIRWLNAEEIFEIRNGYTPSKANVDFWEYGTIPWFRLDDIRAQGRYLQSAFQNVTLEAVKGKKLIPAYSLILSTTATIGEHAMVEVDCLTNQQMTAFTLKEEYKNIIMIKFLFYCFFKYGEWCRANVNKGGGLPIINSNTLKKYCFMVPPLEVQEKIVETLDKFDRLCNDLSENLPAEIEARQKQYEYYRDKLLSF